MSGVSIPFPELEVYDSGWFDIVASTTYVKSHGLATADITVDLYFKDVDNALSLGANRVYLVTAVFSAAAIQHSMTVNNITSTQLTLQVGSRVFSCHGASGSHKYTSAGGQLRVIARRFTE